MPVFYAPAPRGLKEVLFNEFTDLKLKKLTKVASGVSFEGSWADCYRVNLQSRIANRILKPLTNFIAYEPDEFYRHISKHDFTKYIDPNQSLRVEASVTESKLRDQRFVALKTKDAIVDQFRDKFGERPSVDKERADLSIHVYGSRNEFYVYLDTSGDPLLQRGYRKETNQAPLKETLAAGLIYLAKWDKQTPIVDPFCGSGTILIEAALIARQIAPGGFRKHFAFEKLKNFDAPTFDKIMEEVSELETPDVSIKFYGFDQDRESIRIAKANAKRAGVDDLIEFKQRDITQFTPPAPKGIIITNPPYGMRMGDNAQLEWVYKDFAHVLKEHFNNWDTWILSGSQDLSKSLGLKASQRHQVFNGRIECRYLKYHIKKGSYSTRVFRKGE